ncbi:MAG: HAMP domain-containing protein [Pseudonocardia sp.]|nr:HAMP domain-containing protein [Pseudonocardia sp.]
MAEALPRDRATRPGRSVLGWPLLVLLAVVVAVANLGGALIVFALGAWVLPASGLADPGRVRLANVLVFAGYLLVALPVGFGWGSLRFRLFGRAARTDPERRARHLVLYGPIRIVTILATLWLGAVALFGLLNLQFSGRLAMQIAETIIIGGIATCSLSYLLTERILRGPASRVLSGAPPRRRRFVPGVLMRAVLFWALGTAVPVGGLLLAGIAALVFGDVTAERLAVMVLAIGGAALLAGVLTTIGAARATSDPVVAVRRAMHRVEQGDFAVRVPVYDNTELGRLQAGFNTMAEGLAERERIRDLFGRHVGEEVATAATASEEVELGGEIRQVAVLFVDLVGSTAMAAERPATEVVGVLNAFFGVVVEVVERNGGWINKFEGDAALAVFGAPNHLPDAAGCALAAGRELAGRLAAELPDVTAGIGVSAGDAVAGNVGGVRRYEYTVIGDPVNEAARLTELAKAEPGRVVGSGAAVALAGAREAARWRLGDSVQLRGRSEPTRIATPC